MPKLTRAAILKEYKKETDAAWASMSKRFDRAVAKRERQLEVLAKSEVAAGMRKHA